MRSLWTLLAACALDCSETRPNIVLVISDDHGYRDFGLMGSAIVETPRLDALAAEQQARPEEASPPGGPPRLVHRLLLAVRRTWSGAAESGTTGCPIHGMPRVPRESLSSSPRLDTFAG